MVKNLDGALDDAQLRLSILRLRVVAAVRRLAALRASLAGSGIGVCTMLRRNEGVFRKVLMSMILMRYSVPTVRFVVMEDAELLDAWECVCEELRIE